MVRLGLLPRERADGSHRAQGVLGDRGGLFGHGLHPLAHLGHLLLGLLDSLLHPLRVLGLGFSDTRS